MSAVVEAVESIGGAVVDAVEWVGETASNVVQAAIDDPLKTVVQVAAVATGNSWALPYIEGIDTLEEGGSIEDALVNGLKTYVVQQGVGAVVDSFGTAPGVDVNGTTQFFDDGSSIQFFDDGSTLAIDTAGAVTSSPATDIVSGFTDTGADMGAVAEGAAGAGGAEVFPLGETGAPTITPIAGAETVTPEIVASTAEAATPQFNTMEELLASIGEGGTQGPAIGAGAQPSLYDTAQFGAPNVQKFDDGSMLQFFDDGSTLATDMYGEPTFSPATDFTQPGFVDPNAHGFGDMAGAAPIEDRSILSESLPPATDRPLTESLLDIAKEGGSAIYDFATENPLTTLAVGSAAMGALGEKPPVEGPPGEEAKRTFQYQPAAQIGATQGLQELWSAAQSIYGDKLTSMLGITPQQTSGARAASASPLLGGQAPGGIGSLRTSYSTAAAPQTFDVNTLTPEQIIRLQSLVERKKAGEI